MMLPTTSDIKSNRSWLSHFAHILSYSNDLLHLLERKLLGKMIQNITDTGYYLLPLSVYSTNIKRTFCATFIQFESPKMVLYFCYDCDPQNFSWAILFSIIFNRRHRFIFFTSSVPLCWLFATLVCLFRVTQYRNSSPGSILFLIGHS